MTHTLLFHLQNDDPFIGEVDELPGRTDQLITINNPRRKDGKDIHYLESNVISIILPVVRFTFIELISDKMEEEIVSFVKD
jgi:hypothetical protein